MIKTQNNKILSFQELVDLMQRQVEYFESIDKKALTRTKRKFVKRIILLTHVAREQYRDGVRYKL